MTPTKADADRPTAAGDGGSIRVRLQSVPDQSKIFSRTASELLSGWDELPSSVNAQALGQEWLERGEALAMRVPSAVLPEESMILNPRHPDFERVELTVVRPFSFDQHMFKQ
jgi:RES domain-containing protein